MKRATATQAGLTLVELMVSVVISGIAISAALSMGYSMMNAYREHKQTVLVERSARVSLEIVSDQIRNASPGVPANNIVDLAGCDPLMTGLTMVNEVDAPDEVRMVYGAGGVVTSVAEFVFSANENDVDVVDVSGFEVGDYFVVTDLGDPATAVLVRVRDIDAGNNRLKLDDDLNDLCGGGFAGFFPRGSLVIRARMAHFTVVSDASVGNIPTLMVDIDGPDGTSSDPEPVAEGIEDMQVAIGFDVDGDGDIEENGAAGNDDEWWFNHPDDSTILPSPIPRAFRLTLVGRAVNEQSGPSTYVRPAAEDRAEANAPDAYRRRVLTTTIEIRNMAGSI